MSDFRFGLEVEDFCELIVPIRVCKIVDILWIHWYYSRKRFDNLLKNQKIPKVLLRPQFPPPAGPPATGGRWQPSDCREPHRHRSIISAAITHPFPPPRELSTNPITKPVLTLLFHIINIRLLDHHILHNDE
jgi:hypothetical protein